MGKVGGFLILLLAAAAGLFLLYRSSQSILTAPPAAQGLVSGPAAPIDWRLWRELPKSTTRIRIPAYLRQPGQCFYVTAFDTHGNESAPSNVVCFPEDYVPPQP